MKQDFYKQIPLQAKAYDAFIGRDDAIAFAIENLTRVNTFVAGQDKVQSNNLRFPLVGAKGGPGVGKVIQFFVLLLTALDCFYRCIS